MASVSKVTMNQAGARAIMKSAGVKADLDRRIQRMKASAESFGTATYTADVKDGVVSAHAMVKTNGRHSENSNRKHNSLVKCMDAGR